MNRKTKAKWLIAASLCMATVAFAEDVYVKLPTANVLSGKGAGTDHLAQLKQGDKLQVIGREGSWIKVKAGDTEGYVHQNSVSDTKVTVRKGSGNSDSSAGTAVAAGKGLGESLAYAKSKGSSTAGLERMIELRKTVTGSEWQSFIVEGNVGPEKK